MQIKLNRNFYTFSSNRICHSIFELPVATFFMHLFYENGGTRWIFSSSLYWIRAWKSFWWITTLRIKLFLFLASDNFFSVLVHELLSVLSIGSGLEPGQNRRTWKGNCDDNKSGHVFGILQGKMEKSKSMYWSAQETKLLLWICISGFQEIDNREYWKKLNYTSEKSWWKSGSNKRRTKL